MSVQLLDVSSMNTKCDFHHPLIRS